MTALGLSLEGYGFERKGNLWEKHRSIFPTIPAVYAFVAPLGVRNYRWISWSRVDDHKFAVEPKEVFYIGASRSPQKRMDTYRSNAKKGCPQSMEFTALKRATAHYGTWILRMAWEQGVPVHVYTRSVADDLIYLEQLPIDLLHGLEAGLIRHLDPPGNREFRVLDG